MTGIEVFYDESKVGFCFIKLMLGITTKHLSYGHHPESTFGNLPMFFLCLLLAYD